MKFKIYLSLSLFSVILSTAVRAENVYLDQFQRIQEVQLLELQTDENGDEVEVLVQTNKFPTFYDALSKSQGVQKVNAAGVIMMTRELIALGKEIYKIVEAGKPVVEINTEPIEILPRDEDGKTITAMELSGWKAPFVKKYRVATKNYLGMTPASFDFMLVFSYGGNNRGNGAYITGAQIKPTSVNVKWGYSLSAEFKVQTIMNEGAWDDPVAGAVLSIDYKIGTVLQEQQNSKTFYINGKGSVTAY
jgi:hypothetical protein